MDNHWVVNLIAPLVTGIVVGLVMLGGQFLVQPRIAERTQSRTEGWNERRDIFLRATELAIQQFESLQMMSPKPGIPSIPSKLREPPSAEQINRVYYELVLVARSSRTIQAFLNVIPEMNKNKRVTLGDMLEFIYAARGELGFEEMRLKNDQVFFLQPKDVSGVEEKGSGF